MKFFKKLTAIILSAALLLVLASCSDEPKTEVNNTLKASASMLFGDDFLESYKEDPVANAGKIVGFGFTSDEFNEKFVKNGSWRTYNLRIEFGNDNDYGVTIFGVDVQKNGEKNVFISTAGDAVIGLPSKFTGTQDMYCRVIADAALSETDIIKALKGMGIQLLYVNAATGAEDLSEVEQGELLYSDIDFIL